MDDSSDPAWPVAAVVRPEVALSSWLVDLLNEAASVGLLDGIRAMVRQGISLGAGGAALRLLELVSRLLTKDAVNRLSVALQQDVWMLFQVFCGHK